MKFLLLIMLFSAMVSQQKCGNKKAQLPANCYKGRLEVKGICSNYTVKLLEGNIDTATIVNHWKDDVTGKEYSNVFGLANPCSFPDSIKAGTEFYFKLDTTIRNCMVCMAYYPHPPKALSIKVLARPCQ